MSLSSNQPLFPLSPASAPRHHPLPTIQHQATPPLNPPFPKRNEATLSTALHSQMTIPTVLSPIQQRLGIAFPYQQAMPRLLAHRRQPKSLPIAFVIACFTVI
ncbi:hypothetical protein KVT40_004462 [Elsinoe batatas]|uniref:Uncharacterized protein n=1 Tax=Elsinoe batatas TaxID=2601811 RepID=A0A8K0PK90_9PEZI|nr:hypothetical protein KVT40_004462 [Elsinoe batatas]